MAKFLVTNKHGRVFKQVDAHTRVLVAIPGQEISVELAEECGLIEKPEPEMKTKNSPVKRPPASKIYPTKVHKAG